MLFDPKDPQKLLIRNQICYRLYGTKDLYTLHSQDELPLCETSEYMNMKGVRFPSGDLDIVGSCNGVICLLDSKKHITLWNPSIRRKLTLPEPPCFKDITRGARLAVGVGFDPNIDDYKIVMIFYYKHVDTRGIGNPMVYSLKKGTWGEVASPTTSFHSVKSQACFVNRALHWVVKSYLELAGINNSDKEFCRRYILTFDLSSLVFGKIELPEPKQVTSYVTVIEGCLAVISSKGIDNRIWIRGEYINTSSWSLVYNLKDLKCDGRVDRVLRLTNSDFLFNTYSKEFKGVKLYNVLRRERLILAELSSHSYKVDMEMYVESLALLDKGHDDEENQPVCVQRKRRSRVRKIWEKQPVFVQQKRRMWAPSSYDELTDE